MIDLYSMTKIQTIQKGDKNESSNIGQFHKKKVG